MAALPILGSAQTESQVEYTVQIKTDGSATWNARQVGTMIQVSPDVFASFRSNVTALAQSAMEATGRNMSVDNFRYTADVSDRLVVVRFQFEWRNFSRVEPSGVFVDDVFEVSGFFSFLIGDGELYLTYPSSYRVQEVLPEPDERNDTLQRLGWIGTVAFGQGEPQVAFKEEPATFEIWQFISQNAALLAVVAFAVAGISTGYYAFVFRRKNRGNRTRKPESLDPLRIESDEDKVVELLRSSGRGMRQSDIVDRCGFSKAKVSQLLSSLEKKGVIKRYKRGRDKVVMLKESNAAIGEQHEENS